jgi:hypothetical protein
MSSSFSSNCFFSNLVLEFADMDRKHAGEITRVDPRHDDTNPNESTRRRERRLLIKVDLCVLPTVILLYLMCFIDRTNIGNSVARITRPYQSTDDNR